MAFTVYKNKNFAGIVFFYFRLFVDCDGKQLGEKDDSAPSLEPGKQDSDADNWRGERVPDATIGFDRYKFAHCLCLFTQAIHH